MIEHPLEQWLQKRKRAGKPVRQVQLAKEAKCSPPRITQILQGEEPSLGLAVRLSKITGIPCEKFAKAETVE